MENKQIENHKQNEIKMQNNKKTKKSKAQGSKISKNTRRRKVSASSDQNLLPAEIPRSSQIQPFFTEGHQNQTTKTVIRLPVGFLKEVNKEQIIIIQVQKTQIAVKISKRQDILTFEIILKTNKAIDLNEKADDNSSSQQQIIKAYTISGKYVYFTGQQIQNKGIKSVRKNFSTTEFSEYLNLKIKQFDSDFFLYITLRAQQYLTDEFNGLINQGNTCYMNSYLQTLYHIPAFRNLVYESQTQDQSKFPATLQDLFFNLTHSEKAVSAQSLVKSFGWSKKQAAVQQDAQQFSCLFFEVLQRKLNDSMPQKGYKNKTIYELFKGQLNHYIRCTDVSTSNSEQFIDLQIPVMPTLQQSLNAYISEVHLAGDNKYSTEEYGLQQAYKGVKIQVFPPILMLQLKRFQYNFVLQKNTKILDLMQYQQTFDFSPWSLTQQQQQLYELYAVLVHQGSKAQSGHYYCFIKTEKGWYKFNDQFVQQVQKQKVFNYNFGGYHQSLEFDARQMKVNRKFVQSKSTAYMLVYIKSNKVHEIMKDNKQYPQWLQKKDSYKLQLEQLKKNKKHYIHNVKLIDWQKDLKNKQCDDIGFLNTQILENLTTIQRIPKKITILDWLQNKQFDQEATKNIKKGSKNIQNQLQQNPNGVYTYQRALERQIVSGYHTKSHHCMQDLLKESDQPIILKAPFQTKKHQFFVITKKYQIYKQNNEIHTNYIYDDCFAVHKQVNIKVFYRILSQKYQTQSDQNNDSFRRRFYIQGQKIGLLQITQDLQGFLPLILPSKNQLLVCLVEQLSTDLNEQQQIQNTYKCFYQNKKDQVTLQIWQQKTKFNWQLRQMSLLMTCNQLRTQIFEQILQDRRQQYPSIDNIVIRAKQKKVAKNLTQITDSNTILKQLIKYQNKIQFGYSSLSVDSRIAQQQKIIYYRFKDFRFSDPIQVIVDKTQKIENLVNIFKTHPKINQFLQSEGFSTGQAQLCLFNKDRLLINDYVDNQGKVYSKGDLQSVFKKQKHALLVIQGINRFQNQNKMQIQNDKHEDENEITILLHHISQTSQRVGIPRSFKIDKRIQLIRLRNKVYDILDGQVYEWQGKNFKFNPFKTRLLLYVSAGKKTIQLNELQSIEQIERLQIQEEPKKTKDTKKSKNTQPKRKPSAQIQKITQVRNNEEKVNNEQNEAKQNDKQTEQVDKQIQNKQPKTIVQAFPKGKTLKIQVIHTDLIKPNITLRLNVDG